MASILIVDDEEHVRGVLREALESRGHDVLEAATGREAMSRSVQIMIADVIMPDKGGLETLMEAQEELREVKTIVISGRVDMESEAFQRMARQFGVKATVAKPFDLEEIFRLIDTLLT